MAGETHDVGVLLRSEGFVLRREHPALRPTLDWMLRTRRLVPVLPGVYAEPDGAGDFHLRVAALLRWAPDAVLVGRTAARLSFWPTLRSDDVECALRKRGAVAGFRFFRRKVPPDLVVERHGLRLTSPALTAVDLCGADPDAIDEVLRTRAATLPGLWHAFELTRGRRDNARRVYHLLDSRDEPWSAAERLCHRLLRDAGVHGWTTNLPVVADGRSFAVDVAFPGPRLAVEIDGRLHEDDPDVFENDRWRQNALVLDGWTVLRFTWPMLTDHPEVVVETIRRALDMLGATQP